MRSRSLLLGWIALTSSLFVVHGTVSPVAASPAAATVSDGPTWPGQHQVALTFDDGPGQSTQAVLDVLAAHDVDATFFVVGDAVNGSTAPLLASMSTSGHSIQNHSRSHPYLASLPDAQIAGQLSVTSDRVEQATGVRPSCFRPPYGSTSPRVRSVAASQGLSEVMWSTDTNDFTLPGAGTIAARALSDADGRPLTILMHDGGGSRGQTVAALGTIIDGLRARGYSFVTLCSHRADEPAGATRVSWAPPALVPAAIPPAGLVPIDPVRVFDSRGGGPIEGGQVLTVDMAGTLPSDAVAAMLQLTVDAPAGAGFLSVVDCTNPVPATSAVNYAPGAATASGALAAIQAGAVCLYVSATAHVIVDVTARFTPSSTVGLVPTAQTRLIDTRGEPGRLAAGAVTSIATPPDALAVLVTLTAVDAAGTGFLTAWPCDAPPPATSSLNYSPASPAVANGAMLRTGPAGLCVANSAPVDVLVDLLGVFAEGGAPLQLLEPVRLLDTRVGVGGWQGRIAPDQVVDVLDGLAPGDVVVGTVTATGVTGPGFVSLSPDGGAPTTSNLNVSAGDLADFTAVATGSDGRIRATVGGPSGQLILFDIVGWFAAAS